MNNMTNVEFKKLINKYAVILIVSYGLIFLIDTVMQRIFPMNSDSTGELRLVIMNYHWIFHTLINLIIALFIINDSKKLEIKNNLIIVATVLFSLVGVCMFLLIANREIDKASA